MYPLFYIIRDNPTPSQAKKEERLKLLANSENSFQSIELEWCNNQKQRWTERYAFYVLRRLEADIFPILGQKLVNEIKAPELLTYQNAER
jgi:hypothetical protein